MGVLCSFITWNYIFKPFSCLLSLKTVLEIVFFVHFCPFGEIRRIMMTHCFIRKKDKMVAYIGD